MRSGLIEAAAAAGTATALFTYNSLTARHLEALGAAVFTGSAPSLPHSLAASCQL